MQILFKEPVWSCLPQRTFLSVSWEYHHNLLDACNSKTAVNVTFIAHPLPNSLTGQEWCYVGHQMHGCIPALWITVQRRRKAFLHLKKNKRMATRTSATVKSTDIVWRKRAHLNKWRGMDKTPVERFTHKNTDVQPVLALPQCLKWSTGTDNDILDIMNLTPFGVKLRPQIWVVPPVVLLFL